MTTQTIIQLIITYSMSMGIDPMIALAIAKTESDFNPKAVGAIGEVGLFQVRPKFSKVSKKKLKNVDENILEGLRMLKEAQRRCKHQKNNTWVVCYNVGAKQANKAIKHPELFPYYKKVMIAKKALKKELNIKDKVNLMVVENFD